MSDNGPQTAPDGKRFDPGWSDSTWNAVAPPETPSASLLQMLRGVLRMIGFVVVTLALLPPFFIARSMGGRRDRAVAALWCGAGVWLAGLSIRRVGAPMRGGGAILANHASWIDILVIGALAPVHFVAKAEVSGWPVFGWIGRISNTVFIARRRAEAKAQERQLAQRAHAGDLLCLFPEGTSSDGLRVLPFKSTLFALFFADGDEPLRAQAVSLHYRPRQGLPASFYGWWGRMPLFPHIWAITSLSSGGVVTVTFHDPIEPSAHQDRKALAAEAQRLVDAGRRAAAETQSR